MLFERHLWRAIALVFCSLLGGCIIGTWPTPESKSRDPNKPSAMNDEACDGVDDDGDGAVDEGCACTGEARGCVGVESEQCGLGVQYCQRKYWTECLDVTPRWPVRPASVALSVASAELSREALVLEVSATPTTHCELIEVPFVAVELRASEPEMVVRGRAKDDGVAPDLVAGDGVYAVALPNAFGPGVAAQELTVVATAVIDEQPVEAVTAVQLAEVAPEVSEEAP